MLARIERLLRQRAEQHGAGADATAQSADAVQLAVADRSEPVSHQILEPVTPTTAPYAINPVQPIRGAIAPTHKYAAGAHRMGDEADLLAVQQNFFGLGDRQVVT